MCMYVCVCMLSNRASTCTTVSFLRYYWLRLSRTSAVLRVHISTCRLSAVLSWLEWRGTDCSSYATVAWNRWKLCNCLLHCALSLAGQCIVIGPVCGFVCLWVCYHDLEIACIDLHRTGLVGKGSDHLQLIKFWPYCAPGRGSAAVLKKIWLRLTTVSTQCLRLSERFFHCCVVPCRFPHFVASFHVHLNLSRQFVICILTSSPSTTHLHSATLSQAQNLPVG